jgi:hypothetical protein
MTTQTQFQARPFAGDADFQGICDVINTCNQVDQLTDEPYASLTFVREWLMDDPDLDRERDIRLWVDAAGRIAGLGIVRIAPPNADDPEPVVDGNVFMRVLPAARGEGLEAAIVEWAVTACAPWGRSGGNPPICAPGCTRPRRNMSLTARACWKRSAFARCATATRWLAR